MTRGLTTLCILALKAGLAQGQQPPTVVSIGPCDFAGGGRVKDCRVGYRAFGTINPARSNVVLIPTWLQGRSEDWVPSIGPQGYVDTNLFHVIVVDALGDGHSSAPSTVPKSERAGFRRLSIGDMVESQHRLLTKRLGINRLHAVVGFSMGGMQALEWAARYPAFLDRAVSIAGAPRLGAFDHLMWTTMLQEIEIGMRSGTPPDSIWAQLARLEALLVQTPVAVNKSSWDSVMTGASAQGMAYSKSWPLEDFAAQLYAIRRHDISIPFGSNMARAASAIKARVLVVHSPDDHMVTAGPALDFARAIGAETLAIPSVCGHLAFFCEQERMAGAVRSFLAQ